MRLVLKVEGPGGTEWCCSLPCAVSHENSQAVHICSLLVDPQIETRHCRLCNWPRFELIPVFIINAIKYFDMAHDSRRFGLQNSFPGYIRIAGSFTCVVVVLCVSNDVCASLCAAHQEAPGASIHVSPIWIRLSFCLTFPNITYRKKSTM